MVSVSPDSVSILEVTMEGERQTAITFELYVISNGNRLIKVDAAIFFKVVMVIWVMSRSSSLTGKQSWQSF